METYTRITIIVLYVSYVGYRPTCYRPKSYLMKVMTFLKPH